MSPRYQLWSIRDRATFHALRGGRRGRAGVVSVTWVAPAADAAAAPPRIAFAIGRTTGGAVVRNRIRRRLRSALQELNRSGAVPAGAYLVSARVEAAELTWADLLEDLRRAIAGATGLSAA